MNFIDELNAEAQKEKQSDPVDEPQNKAGGFFTLNLLQINDMVKKGAGAEEAMAYLVLVRGTHRSSNYSTHGANSIATRTGLTHYRAEKTLEWLAEQGYISKTAISKEKEKKRIPKWQINDALDVLDVALANSLADGIGRGKTNPPLARIYNEVSLGNHGMKAEARLDALMVLLHLYRHHLMADYGGVNPRAGIFRSWQAADNFNGEQVVDVNGTNAALYEIEGANSWTYDKFALEALFYVTDKEERGVRFWDAFHNLHELGFMYEVTQVWSGNPEKDKKAEPLYTLYIHDRHARESEPYLSSEVHKAAMRRGTMSGYSFSTQDPWENVAGTGRFRFIANKKVGGFPIGIYRLRFRPHTKDTGKGMEAERSRVADWTAILSRL